MDGRRLYAGHWRGTNAVQGFVDGSRYGYMFGLVLVAIVLVFSFMLKGGKRYMNR